MNRIYALTLAAALLALLAACGGDSGDRIEVALEVDVPEGVDEGAVVAEVRDVLRHRAEAFGMEGARFSIDGRVITASVRDVREDDARELFTGTGEFEIRRPQMAGEDNIVCVDANEVPFAAPVSVISYRHVEGTRWPLPWCLPEVDALAAIAWETGGGDDPSLVLTSELVAGARVDRGDQPVVLVDFTEDGTMLLRLFTEALVGYPMGIFVDDELRAGPTIGQALDTGNVAIAGMSLPEANILAAQLDSGPLPAPVREVPSG